LWQYLHYSSLIYISCIDEDMLMLGNPYWLTCCLGDAKQTGKWSIFGCSDFLTSEASIST
jgi:hypothetical protein